MPKDTWDQRKVSLAKGMVYLHFGFEIGTGVDISSQIATPLAQAHLAGSLNHIGASWVPQAGDNEYAFTFLTPDDVAGKTPAGELMRLCYMHLQKRTTMRAAMPAAKGMNVFDAAATPPTVAELIHGGADNSEDDE